MTVDVAVIGGGPAGLLAAATAAKNNKSTLLIEKNARTGRKLLITGKGRCNVTNNCTVEKLISSVPVNGKFLFSAFYGFTPEDTINLFEGLGVPLKTERGGRVFPESDKAMDIADALLKHARLCGVKFLFSPALNIEKNNDLFYIETEKETILARSVILATGGKSYPLTGSTGDGYSFAEKFGHTVITPRPALIPLITDGDAKAMQGLSLKNVAVTLMKKGEKKPLYSEIGEMLFTHFGLSGPLILTASCYLDKGEHNISVDLKPALTPEKLNARLLRDFSENINKDIRNILPALLPLKLIPTILKRSKINPEKKANEITSEERKRLITVIKNLSFNVLGTRPIEEAIITRGGISVKEINPKTMESKIVSGLYFAGEIIDVNAFTGGYNLQIAFSTAVLAGGAN